MLRISSICAPRTITDACEPTLPMPQSRQDQIVGQRENRLSASHFTKTESSEDYGLLVRDCCCHVNPSHGPQCTRRACFPRWRQHHMPLYDLQGPSWGGICEIAG